MEKQQRKSILIVRSFGQNFLRTHALYNVSHFSDFRSSTLRFYLCFRSMPAQHLFHFIFAHRLSAAQFLARTLFHCFAEPFV